LAGVGGDGEGVGNGGEGPGAFGSGGFEELELELEFGELGKELGKVGAGGLGSLFEDGDVVVAHIGGELVLFGLEFGLLFSSLLGDGGIGVTGGGGADLLLVGEELVHGGVEEGEDEVWR